MKLGGFWGLPAPMMVVAHYSDENFLNHFSSVNTEMNREIFQDVHSELAALMHLRDFSTVVFDMPENCISSEYPDCVCSSGKFSVEGISDQVLKDDLAAEMTLMLAQMIADGEQSGKMVSLSDPPIAHLRAVVDKAIASGEFRLRDTRKVVRRLYRSLKSEDGRRVVPPLAEALNGRICMREVVRVAGKNAVLSQNAKIVAEWFLARLDSVRLMYDRTIPNVRVEETVFGLPFFDLIHRKPESVLYAVINRFNQVKGKRSANALLAVCNDLRSNLKNFFIYFEKYVEDSSVETVSASPGFDLSKVSGQKGRFFQNMISEGEDGFHSDACSEISSMFDIISRLDYAYLNEVFGLNCTDSEWDSLSRELCSVCICGINNQSLDLMYESIFNFSFAVDIKVKKTEEYKQRMSRILSDLDSLLSTIRPIGDVLV